MSNSVSQDKRERMLRHKIDSYLREELSEKFCLAPIQWRNDCSGTICRAHTVPKSNLRCIARKGKVYSLKTNLFKLKKNQKQIPECIAIRRASIFSGFCSTHDNAIFSPVEENAFKGTKEQCFLLDYRALAFTLHRHAAQARVDWRLAREGYCKDLGWYKGRLAALEDLHGYKSVYDKVLTSRDFDSVRGYVVEFNSPPPVMCSESIFPDQTFAGILLQDYVACKRLDMISFTFFSVGEKGAVVFAWNTESDNVCSSFIKSLMIIPDEYITSALLRLLFTYSDNIHMSPDWWEGLPEAIKRSAIERIQVNFLKENALADDGVVFDPWTISCRYHI